MAGVSGIFPLELTDRHLSYLPLAHIFERIVMCQCYSNGASIAFFRGDPLLLIEDLQACRPTILPAAPRVLNKIYDKIQGGIAAAGGFKKKLFDAAVATKTRNLLTTGELAFTTHSCSTRSRRDWGWTMYESWSVDRPLWPLRS